MNKTEFIGIAIIDVIALGAVTRKLQKDAYRKGFEKGIKSSRAYWEGVIVGTADGLILGRLQGYINDIEKEKERIESK